MEVEVLDRLDSEQVRKGLSVVAFCPSQVEKFLSRLYKNFDLFFAERGRIESLYRRKFPPKGREEVKVSFSFLPERVESFKGVLIHLTSTVVSLKRIRAERLYFLFPEKFSFSCGFLGTPCEDWNRALTVIWEWGKCRGDCYGMWELFFVCGWYYADGRKAEYENFTLNGRKLKTAQKLCNLLKEAYHKRKALKVSNLEEVVYVPVSRNVVLRMREQDDNPALIPYVQAGFELEAAFLGGNFWTSYLTLSQAKKWKEEKNVSYPDGVTFSLFNGRFSF